MQGKTYCGYVVPMTTPVTQDGTINEEGARYIIDYLLKHDIYPFILGTTGESASIPEAEKIRYV